MASLEWHAEALQLPDTTTYYIGNSFTLPGVSIFDIPFADVLAENQVITLNYTGGDATIQKISREISGAATILGSTSLPVVKRSW